MAGKSDSATEVPVIVLAHSPQNSLVLRQMMPVFIVKVLFFRLCDFSKLTYKTARLLGKIMTVMHTS